MTGALPGDRAALRGGSAVRDAQGRVQHESLTDPVTDLPNRLHFEVVYRLFWEAGSRGIPITLLRFDMPGLGQAAADLQRQLGDRLNRITRRMDMVARLEPDRIGVLFMDCNAFGGMVAAERFAGDLEPFFEQLGIPFHGGLAAWKDWMTKPDDLMVAAEDAMATARSRGERVDVHHR